MDSLVLHVPPSKRQYWDSIFKLLRSPGIDSKESIPPAYVTCVGNLSPAKGIRNQVGIGLPNRPASLFSLATQFQTRFLESFLAPQQDLSFRLSTTTWFLAPLDCFKIPAQSSIHGARVSIDDHTVFSVFCRC